MAYWLQLYVIVNTTRPPTGSRRLHGYFCCGDAGSDQAATRRLLGAKISTSTHAPDTATIFIGRDCIDHQCHLPSKTGLLIIDAVLAEEDQPFRYFSALAKTVNVWRASARGMYSSWESVHGPIAAVSHGKKLPPRCLSGRWMSVAATEERLNSVAHELPQVYDHCFSRATPSSDLVSTAPGDDMSAFVVEDQKEHRLKMGRWRADTARVLKLDQFWNVIAVSQHARLPLQHMHLFCQTRFGDGPDDKHWLIGLLAYWLIGLLV